MNRDYLSLELDKVLDMLAGETSCADAADAARAVTPARSADDMRAVMNETTDAYRLLAKFGGPSFGGISNVKGSLARAAAGAVLTCRELLQISETLRVIRSLVEWRGRCAGVATCLDERFARLVPNKYLEDKINAAIISEDEIADGASPALSDIRRKMRAASSKIRDKLDSMIKSAAYRKYLQEPIVTIRSGRYVVPVKAEFRGEVAGLIHDSSSSGATLFVEPVSVVEANNEIRILQNREADEIERILSQLSAEAGGFAAAICDGYDTAVGLNLIFAKANLAYKMKAVSPDITDNGKIDLRRARHPLLDPKTAVPVDITLGDKFDTLVITGPNTGGKTVAIKTIGLLSLMCMCGLMIPAGDGSTVSFFDNILVDIGDEQSIEQSLSTFSAHMVNIRRILDACTSHSLVLLDELGAGTDPVEGAALATAILEKLRTFGAVIAATTHYAELKEYALRENGVENGSCEFDVATLRPTYKLLIGVPGRSNAFAISKRLGIPDGIIDRAKELVSSEDTRFEDVVGSLLDSRRALEEERALLERLKEEAELAKETARKATERAESERAKVIEDARAAARDIVYKTRLQTEQLLGEMEALKKQANAKNAAQRVSQARAAAKAGLRSIEDTADPVDERVGGDYRLPRPLKVGDSVLIADIDRPATVLTVPDSGGNVTVQAGIIKTKVKLENLRLIEKKTTQPKRGGVTRQTRDRMTRSASAEIDLRGQSVDEAVMELDSFIDNAVMSGVGTISIIHGKGTGVLRAGIQEYLRKNSSVRTFRLGVYGEGADGVTIAELK